VSLDPVTPDEQAVTPEEKANAAARALARPSVEPGRRLSTWRLSVVVVTAVAVAGALVAFRAGSNRPAVAVPVSFFSPYVDVTATPQFAFEDPSQLTSGGAVLGFVVSPAATAGTGAGTGNSAAGGSACDPSWGGVYSLDAAASGLDLDRRIARVEQRGGQVSASFGGAANAELAIGCTDTDDLEAAYRSVVDRYSLSAIDFDIESVDASAPAVDSRRAAAVRELQQDRAAAGHPLSVWLTLPVATTGLTSRGLAVLDALLDAHVDLAGINALTMDFSEVPPAAGEAMTQRIDDALLRLQRQIVDRYRAAGTGLTDTQAWQLVGATAMIGQNDIADQIFEPADARNLVDFAKVHHLARLSIWSANRDQTCGVNYANPEVVSDDCSGVNQQPGAFSAIFDTFVPAAAAADVAAANPANPAEPSTASAASAARASGSATMVDDPATSPYPIWNADGQYPANTKIVWHHNVYEAKWWTQGDLPDSPVTNPADTPWTLIGPVLPGEHPAPLPTLSAGTYPQWSAATVYVAGQRVLYQGVGYQAKWWTQDQPPQPNPLQPADTPWQLLT
jgi:chitinase